eukprot:1142377-Pelagomonas_calceolata.AAC.10
MAMLCPLLAAIFAAVAMSCTLLKHSNGNVAPVVCRHRHKPGVQGPGGCRQQAQGAAAPCQGPHDSQI